MDRFHLIYAACGSLAVVLALVSREMHRLPLSEPLLAMLVGITLGLRCSNYKLTAMPPTRRRLPTPLEQ